MKACALPLGWLGRSKPRGSAICDRLLSPPSLSFDPGSFRYDFWGVNQSVRISSIRALRPSVTVRNTARRT